ncbi:hypothetical protein AS4_08380 [Acinetobacter guillouiae]|nr:hypothetical protein AS4_08380 [Acinetobacter guillouiae]
MEYQLQFKYPKLGYLNLTLSVSKKFSINPTMDKLQNNSLGIRCEAKIFCSSNQ